MFCYYFVSDATSSGEAVNLQHRLRSLSTGLVGLRHVLHEQQLTSADLSQQQQLHVTEQHIVAGGGYAHVPTGSGPLPPPPPELPSPLFHPSASRGGMATTANSYMNHQQAASAVGHLQNHQGFVQGKPFKIKENGRQLVRWKVVFVKQGSD